MKPPVNFILAMASRALAALLLATALRQSAGARPPAAFDVTYEPAAAERKWLVGQLERGRWVHATPVEGRICRTANAREQIAQQKTALRAADAAFAHEDVVRTASDALSRLTICQPGPSRGGGSGDAPPCDIEPIEPLSGVARHPLVEIGCGLRANTGVMNVSKYNLTHLVFASRCPRKGSGVVPRVRFPQAAMSSGPPAPRALLFDAGCGSTFAAGPLTSDTAPLRDGPTPPLSLPLFARMYEAQCIRFDELHGWEADPADKAFWWQGVPHELRPRVHFHNVPVVPGDPTTDVLLHIVRTARPEDFVVLKIDIDNFKVEYDLVSEIRTNRRGTNVSALIDEFFFEYHFRVRKEMPVKGYRSIMPFWRVLGKRGHSVDDALALMREFRQLGIRSHFWV